MSEMVTVVGDLDQVRFNDSGLVPVIAQDASTREVLMLAWMDGEAIRRTVNEGRVTYFSRSRQEYWRKGDTSGHVQWAKTLKVDCDGDTLLVLVDQTGPACHTGAATCFDGAGS
jgi:phosphoribosyl-AMP cyclohydrolase